jgi:hypothetical protein
VTEVAVNRAAASGTWSIPNVIGVADNKAAASTTKGIKGELSPLFIATKLP